MGTRSAAPSGQERGSGYASRPRPIAWAGLERPYGACLQVRRTANLSTKIMSEPAHKKISKMKVALNMLLKIKGRKNDKMSYANILIKLNNLSVKLYVV